MEIKLIYRLKCSDKLQEITYDSYHHLGTAIASCYDNIEIIEIITEED